jgi:hypothetical protein
LSAALASTSATNRTVAAVILVALSTSRPAGALKQAFTAVNQCLELRQHGNER